VNVAMNAQLAASRAIQRYTVQIQVYFPARKIFATVCGFEPATPGLQSCCLTTHMMFHNEMKSEFQFQFFKKDKIFLL
jgi:hypothetical protein